MFIFNLDKFTDASVTLRPESVFEHDIWASAET